MICIKLIRWFARIQVEMWSLLSALWTVDILFIGNLSLRNPSTNCCTESTVISAPSSITTYTPRGMSIAVRRDTASSNPTNSRRMSDVSPFDRNRLILQWHCSSTYRFYWLYPCACWNEKKRVIYLLSRRIQVAEVLYKDLVKKWDVRESFIL